MKHTGVKRCIVYTAPLRYKDLLQNLIYFVLFNSGEQTRQCGPGDIVTISGMFLTVSL
jgi:hypothetical protein